MNNQKLYCMFGIDKDIMSALIGGGFAIIGTILGYFLNEVGKRGKIKLIIGCEGPQFDSQKEFFFINCDILILNTSLEPKSIIELIIRPVGEPKNANNLYYLQDSDGKFLSNNFKLEPRGHIQLKGFCKVDVGYGFIRDEVYFEISYTNEKGKYIKERIAYG